MFQAHPLSRGDVEGFREKLSKGLDAYRVRVRPVISESGSPESGSLYQLRINVPHLRESFPPRHVQESASVFLGLGRVEYQKSAMVYVETEWYGLPSEAADILKAYNPSARLIENKMKTGDFSYEMVYFREGRTLVVTNGSYSHDQLPDAAGLVAQGIIIILDHYKNPMADGRWKKRVGITNNLENSGRVRPEVLSNVDSMDEEAFGAITRPYTTLLQNNGIARSGHV